MELKPENERETSPLPPIRVETALSRWPFHKLSRKGNIEICLNEQNPDGSETRWEVDYSKKYGQPGPLAYKLDTLIINRRIEEASRPVPRLLRLGSLKEICRELGMAETGGNTNQIKKSLFQNALAGITAKTSYRLTDGSEKVLEAVFTRYSVILTGEQFPNGKKADAVYLLLNEIFMRVINGAMTRPLDYGYLKSLSPAPQRFYEILSYQMYSALKWDRPRAKLTYSDLCSHAPLTRHLDWENARSQMNKIHRPHLLSGYIARVESELVRRPDGTDDWIFLYVPGPRAKAEYRTFTKRGGPSVLEVETQETVQQAIEAPLGALQRELVEQGVSEAIANSLICEHPEEKIRSQLERLAWLLETNPAKIAEPAAYLVESIKHDYAPPKRYISKAQREKRAAEKRNKEKGEEEARREKQANERKDREEQESISRYWEGLSLQERAEHDQAALAAATDDERNVLKSGPMKRFGMAVIRENYTRKLLSLKSPIEETVKPDHLF